MTRKESLDRRDFLKKSAAAGVGAFAASRGIGPLFAFEGSPNEKMVVGVMGLNGRGMVHAQDFARGVNTTVGYLCDVDSNVLAKAMAATTPLQGTVPKAIGDFRRILDSASGMRAGAEHEIERLHAIARDSDRIAEIRRLQGVQRQLCVVGVVFDEENVDLFSHGLGLPIVKEKVAP